MKILTSFAKTSNLSSISTRLRCMFILATVLGCTFITISIVYNSENVFYKTDISSMWNELDYYDKVNDEESFTINTPGCSIPSLKPFDETIKKFVFYPTALKPCPAYNSTLLINNNTHIWVNKESLKNYYNITSLENISCCYRSFHRPSSIENILSNDLDDRVKYSDCTYFHDAVIVGDEFVRVQCKNGGKQIYQQFFLFARPKKFLVHDETRDIKNNKQDYNIIILGIDAVSRHNFYRTMPKTWNYLKTKTAIEMMGYNKVGDNTFPNLMPMLLGIKDFELKKTCLPYDTATFDNCPFIWEWFKQAGYYTALAEDSGWMGTFNYAKVGFSRTPTDYYIHTFIREAEKYVGTNKDGNSNLCMNEKYFFQVLLDYVKDLTKTLRFNKLFGFFWEITMSHDSLNYPMVMDASYEKFFRKLEDTDYLANTIILLVSDHGIRWGDIRSTKQGRLEERLPFLYVLLPKSFQENYTVAYENLKLNRKRLTTSFDVYATLIDLINLENIKNEVIISREKKFYAYNRGISLFLPIPGNRTCKMAGIDDHWCTCHRGHTLSTDSFEAIKAAANLVKKVNKVLKKYTQCSKLRLAAILEATEMTVGSPDEKEEGWREFLVVVRTEPGNGIFEATLRYNEHNWKLAGSISRLNLYGNQSRCVHNYQMKLYCYCAE